MAAVELPVTVLSGFLGAGKTTLLKSILTKQNEYKVAVVVNDMAELNIDGLSVSNAQLTQTKEELVQLENGCICCTLRADLLKSLAELADKRAFDLVVVESTGISEPMQVAETFALALEGAELQAGEDVIPSLKGKARLDTCVTVVDAVNFFNEFEEYRSVCDKFEDADQEDDRSIASLMVDQIEFADVILVNKADLVSEEHLAKVMAAVRKLNANAVVHVTRYSEIEPSKVLNTGLYSPEQAYLAPGWLKSLREELKPESEEYGVSSFVYRRRRPFHPQRLYDLVRGNFVLTEMAATPVGEDEACPAPNKGGHSEEFDSRVRAYKSGPFQSVLRSKGFAWLATRNDRMGDWSQAGVMLTLSNEMPWFAAVDENDLPEDMKKEVQRDFEGEHGDRRQEIVIIGFDAREKQQEIERALDACLCTDSEWENASELEDPWAEWGGFEEIPDEDALMTFDECASSSIALVEGSDDEGQAWKFLQEDRISAVGHLRFAGGLEAQEAANRLVSLGERAEMFFYFTADKDDAEEKFLEEVSKDFHDVAHSAAREGSRDLADAMHGILPHVSDVVSRMLNAYDPDVLDSGDADMCFLLKIEVNIPGACVKLHLDSIGVRFVMSMAGGGTVVADGEAVNWDAWNACEGLLPMGDMNEDDIPRAIHKFNLGLCPKERQLQFRNFDLLMIKGEVGNGKPCIHRAPASAADDQVHRLLVKLDYVPRESVQKYVQLVEDTPPASPSPPASPTPDRMVEESPPHSPPSTAATNGSSLPQKRPCPAPKDNEPSPKKFS